MSDRKPSDTLERNLRMLLTRAYEIPEYREGFRADLLTELKSHQRLRAAFQRRSGASIYVLGALTGAAAALLITLALPFAEPMEEPLPAGPAFGVAPDFSVAVADPKNDWTAEEPKHLALVLKQPDQKEKDAPRGRAFDLVEMRSAADQAWRHIQPNDHFTYAEGVQLRTRPGVVTPVGVWVDKNTKLALLPGSMMTCQKDGFSLDRGRAFVSLAEAGRAFRVRLPDREVSVEPGSEVYFKIENSDAYAEGGAPAPMLVVLKGEASVLRGETEPARLLAGSKYFLYDTVTGDIPHAPLHSLERRQVDRYALPAANTTVRMLRE